MNTVKFIGNAGSDAKVTTLLSGEIVTRFNLATSETFTNKNGEQETKTEWHPIVAWGKTAEVVAKFVKKGSCVVIKAKAVNNRYDKVIQIPLPRNRSIDHTINVFATEYQAYDVTVM